MPDPTDPATADETRRDAEWKAHVAQFQFAEDPGPPPSLVNVTVEMPTPGAGGAGDVMLDSLEAAAKNSEPFSINVPARTVLALIVRLRAAEGVNAWGRDHEAQLMHERNTYLAERDALRAAVEKADAERDELWQWVKDLRDVINAAESDLHRAADDYLPNHGDINHVRAALSRALRPRPDPAALARGPAVEKKP